MKFLHFNIYVAPSTSNKFKRKWQSRTVAAEEPSAQYVHALAADFLGGFPELAASLNLGLTLVSLKDKYNKKEGRRQALSKMKPTLIAVKSVLLTKSHIFVHLENFGGVDLSLRTNRLTGYTTVTGSIQGAEGFY